MELGFSITTTKGGVWDGISLENEEALHVSIGQSGVKNIGLVSGGVLMVQCFRQTNRGKGKVKSDYWW